MAWGIDDPGSFGDFFPPGDYVGWEEAIKYHFEHNMTAEQRRDFDNWDVNYRGDIARKFKENFGPLDLHERPLEFKLSDSRKSLASLISLPNGLLAVDGVLKDIIQTLEPDAHQVWPLRITMPKDVEYPRPYYGLVIGRFIDSFVLEGSAVHQVMIGSEFYHAKSATKKGYGELVLSRNVFSGSHLWREKRLSSPNIFISDDFYSEIIRNGLRIPKHYELKVI